MILVWTVVLLLVGYTILFLRYHYRTADTITILQCSADTFNTELLRERQPIVCEDLKNTTMFSVLREGELTPEVQADVLSNLSHFSPRFGRARPIQRIQPKRIKPKCTDNHASRKSFVRSLCDVRLYVQLEGTSRVWLTPPNQLNASPEHAAVSSPERNSGDDYHPEFVEIVLREGNAVFVPFLWGVQVFAGEAEGTLNENHENHENHDNHENNVQQPSSRRCVYADVGWDNWVLDGLQVHGWVVGND